MLLAGTSGDRLRCVLHGSSGISVDCKHTESQPCLSSSLQPSAIEQQDAQQSFLLWARCGSGDGHLPWGS